MEDEVHVELSRCAVTAQGADRVGADRVALGLGLLAPGRVPVAREVGGAGGAACCVGQHDLDPLVEPVPEPTADVALATLDRAPLAAIRALRQPGQPDPLERVVGLYLQSALSLKQRLQQALTAGDAEELRQAAHTLKSSSANLGGQRLAARCRELEALGRDGRLPDAAAKFAQVEHEFAGFVVALEAVIRPAELKESA